MSDLFASQEQTRTWLVTRGAKGEIRCFEIWYEKEGECYIIHRQSSQWGGKIVEQPSITICEGKVKRDTHAQTILKFLSLIKEKKDKGYKELERDFYTYSKEEIDKLLPKENTDANGFKKHMLAKAFDKVKKSTIDNEEYWYASRKIDGVRCSFYWNGDKIVTASRGGGNYDPACIHFIQHPEFIEFFKRHPEVILDLELYKHGMSLQQISGAARLEKNAYDCKWLEGYIYDVMYSNVPFKTRLKILNQISKELNLSFDPYRHWEKGELQLQMVPHVKVSGYDNIMELHNKYVEEGFEGVVIRNPNKPYGFGKRTNDMIKIKCYKDDCFTVVDAALGLRGSEDMVFICETKDGKTFKAKPLGDREQKEEYWNNFEQKYKGRLGECKFFYYSDEGVPLQPAFKAFRYDI